METVHEINKMGATCITASASKPTDGRSSEKRYKGSNQPGNKTRNDQKTVKYKMAKLTNIGAKVYIEGNREHMRAVLTETFGKGSCSINRSGQGWIVTRNK